MKKIVWLFSFLYVAVPALVVWYIWTGDVDLREGLEHKGKLYTTGLCILLAIVANWIAWHAYRTHKKLFGGNNEEAEN